jgi:hypothetical protein
MARRRKKKQVRIKQDSEGVKRRNPYALIASWRSGSGRHQDRRKAQNKKACRGRVTQE